jgi:hypothetical protein
MKKWNASTLWVPHNNRVNLTLGRYAHPKAQPAQVTPNTFDAARTLWVVGKRFQEGGRMSDQRDGDSARPGSTDDLPRFAYDDRPVHRISEEQRPLESLAGRGQTEGTPMGLGRGLGWTVLAVAGAFGLLILGTYFWSLLR